MNLFPELIESGSGKTKYAMYGRPGQSDFCTLSAGVGRGMWPGENRLFAVAGSKLYEILSNGTSSLLGDVENDGKPVGIAANGNQLLITSNSYVFCDSGSGPEKIRYSVSWTGLKLDAADNTKITSTTGGFDSTDIGRTLVITGGGTGLTVGTYTITAVSGGWATLSAGAGTVGSTGGEGTEYLDYVRGTWCAFLDGFFLVGRDQYNDIQMSALYDGKVWDPLDVGTKQMYPDHVNGLLADHEELWIGGSESSMEVWRNTGNADFPFERDLGAAIHYGCVASWSMVRLDDSVAWLGGDEVRGGPVAWQARGFVPVRVSTHAVENVWRGYSKVSDAIGYSYMENGHHFWVLTFPTANATWVYDSSTKMWHERGYGSAGSWTAMRGWYHAWVGLGTTAPAHYVLSGTDGKIFKQTIDLFQDSGAAINWERTSPHVAQEMTRVRHDHLRLVAGDGLSPTLYVSDDGGTTFDAGRTGYSGSGFIDYWRLGQARDRVYRLRGAENARVALLAAELLGVRVDK